MSVCFWEFLGFRGRKGSKDRGKGGRYGGWKEGGYESWDVEGWMRGGKGKG